MYATVSSYQSLLLYYTYKISLAQRVRQQFANYEKDMRIWGTFHKKMENYEILGYSLTSYACLLYTSPSPRDLSTSRMPSSA